MQRKLRIVMSLVLAWTMTINPTAACNCGRGGGGGYYSGYSPSYSGYYGGGSYASYYRPYGGYDRSYSGYDASSSGWGGYGYGGYGYGGYYGGSDSCCGGCGWSDCGSCYSDCGGCSDCGSGCSDCGGCSGCSSGETTVEGSTVYGEPSSTMEMKSSQPTMAPAAPAYAPAPATVNKQPAKSATITPMPPQSTTRTTRPDARPMERSQPLPPQTHNTFSQPGPGMKEPATNSNDLFAPSTEEKAAAPSAPANNDLFSPTESGPSGLSPAEKPAENDLFAPPAEEPNDAAPAKPADDDLFKSSSNILGVPGGLSSGALRRWVDNTGDYSCRGRLLRVMDGKVQILKDNGRTTTVSMDRLSQGDLEFVHLQASAQRVDAMSKTAQVIQ